MATTVILCGPAAEDNFSFEDLVDAECRVVQEMAHFYGVKEPATIKDLEKTYEIIYVFPVRTCIKAAGLWALDANVEVWTIRNINFGMEIPLLSEEVCQSLFEEYGLYDWSHNSQFMSGVPKLLFMPKEAEVLLGSCNCFPLVHPLLDIITAVQHSTEQAVLQETRPGRSK